MNMHIPDVPGLKIEKNFFQEMTGYGCISWRDASGYGSSLQEMDHHLRDMHLPKGFYAQNRKKKIFFHQEMTGDGDAGYGCISWRDGSGDESSLQEIVHLPKDTHLPTGS